MGGLFSLLDHTSPRVRGLLIGVLSSPRRGGVTCIIEVTATQTPLLCDMAQAPKEKLEGVVGHTVEIEGTPLYSEQGKVLRLTEAVLVTADIEQEDEA